MSGVDVPTDDLLALLRGDLARARAIEVVDHLRGCADCRRDMVDVAATHGSLTAARRVLEPTPVPAADDGPPAAHLPPLRLPAARLPRRRWLAGAAAVAVVATALASGVLMGRRDQPVGTVASVPLQPVSGSAAGRVTMSGPAATTAMTISTQRLPDAGSGRYYYAWLLDPATNKMLPLGLVSATAATHFEVSSALVRRYHAVDISLQSDDGNPAHSATSVLRATY